MPSVSASNLNLLRTTRHATRLNLAVYQPASIWTAQVDGAQTQGDTTITVKGVSQAKAPARNFQVMFSAIGYGQNELGEARWKSYGAPTLTVGAHNTPLANNTYITVKEEIKPLAIHAVLNSSDVVFEDGSTAYTAGATGENLQYHPLARMGPPACAIIDPSTGLATINFYSSSTAIATGATLGSYAWVFPSGTPATSTTPGTSGSPVAVTWNAPGQYYVSLTVTDSNGKTHTTYRPVFIYDTTTVPYSALEIQALDGDVSSGIWRASLKVWGAASETEFPDNAMVVLFAEDWYGDTKGSIGGQYTHRENVVWVGYVRGGSIKKNAQYGYIQFDAESVSGVMTNLEGLAATLTTTAGTPTGWHQLQNMTYNRAAFHILTEHSTVSQIADCYLSLLTFTRNTLDVPEASVFDQLQTNVATPTRGRCGCSAQGMFYLEENPQLIPLSDRTHPNVFANSPAPDAASTSLADFRDELDFGRDLHDKVTALIDFAAESTAAVAIYSLAPATPWASGRGERISGIRADSQGDSNIFSGLFEGYENNPFADVLLPLRGNYRIFDIFPPEQVQVTLTAAQNKRGIAWSNQRCWVKRINYEYRPGGVLLSTVVVEKDAYGYPGITGNYPVTPPPWPPPDPPPIEPPPIVPPPPTIIPPGKGNLLYVNTNHGVAKCVMAYGTNGTDGAPVWSDVSNGLTGGGLVTHAFNLDPFSLSGDHFTAAWVTTDDGIWRCTGLPDAPVWVRKLSQAQIEAIFGAGSVLAYSFALSVRRNEALFLVKSDAGTTPTIYPLYTRDNGATWNYSLTARYQTDMNFSADQYPGVYCSYFNNDTYYYTGRIDSINGVAAPARTMVVRATGTPITNLVAAQKANAGAPMNGDTKWALLFLPYANSNVVIGNDLRMYLGDTSNSSGTSEFYRYTSFCDPLANDTMATPVGSSEMSWGYGWPRSPYRLIIPMFDDTVLYVFGFQGDPINNPSNHNLWRSANGGTSWTGYVTSVTFKNLYTVPIDKDILYGVGGNEVKMSINGGAAWADVNSAGFRTAMTPGGLSTDNSFIVIDYYKV